jgi:hypothetical protein
VTKKAKPLLSEALAYSRSPEGGGVASQEAEVTSPKKRLQSAVKNKHGSSNMRSNRRPSENNNNNTRGTGTPLNDTSMNRKTKGVS